MLRVVSCVQERVVVSHFPFASSFAGARRLPREIRHEIAIRNRRSIRARASPPPQCSNDDADHWFLRLQMPVHPCAALCYCCI